MPARQPEDVDPLFVQLLSAGDVRFKVVIDNPWDTEATG